MPRTSARPRLRSILPIALLILSGPRLRAQRPAEITTLSPLPPGTTLPVLLEHGLRAGRTPVGTRVSARTTQRVPVGPNLYLKAGAHLLGEVSASTVSTSPLQPATLGIRFTTLRYRGHDIPIRVEAVAIANFTDVSDTFAPVSGGPDRGNPSAANWTTRQVGGDEVYRSGWVGDVFSNVMRKVGSADFNGVYRDPAPGRSSPSLGFPLAVGVFSADASGLYGFDPGTTLHSAAGAITLDAPSDHPPLLHGGDNLLLQVIP